MEKNTIILKREIVGKSYIYIPVFETDEILCLRHFDKLALTPYDVGIGLPKNTRIVLSYDSEF